MKIVAFGDSNTRYWLGDFGVPGPQADAWPARLEEQLRARGIDAQVWNQGYAGEQVDFAQAEFQRLTAGADLCVLGFGTNDVKRLDVSLQQYLCMYSNVLDQAAALGLPMIVLGIPWFDQGLAGAEAQARIPHWNTALSSLCQQYRLPFLDLYHPFQGDTERWFNERATPKRHLSKDAQLRVAELVLPLIMAHCGEPRT